MRNKPRKVEHGNNDLTAQARHLLLLVALVRNSLGTWRSPTWLLPWTARTARQARQEDREETGVSARRGRRALPLHLLPRAHGLCQRPLPPPLHPGSQIHRYHLSPVPATAPNLLALELLKSTFFPLNCLRVPSCLELLKSTFLP